MWEEASVSNRQEHIISYASLDAPPGAVCRTHRSIGEGLTKYYSNYFIPWYFINTVPS